MPKKFEVKEGSWKFSVKISIEDPVSDKARFCVEQFALEIGRRPIAGFDPSMIIAADPLELALPRGLFLVATFCGDPIGSAALCFDSRPVATLHRMWVDPSARSLGVGRQLIDEIEKRARNARIESIRLETHSSLHEAIAFYRRRGYVELDAFSNDSPADHWFEKRLI